VDFAQRFQVKHRVCFREPAADDPRGIPNHNRKSRYVVGNNTTSSDDSSGSDTDATEDDRARANPYVIADVDCVRSA
jgi:hypothetical protein